MKHSHKLILYILLLLSSLFLNAQQKKLKKANANYNQNAYIEAASIYLKVAESGFESEELFTRLANSLYFNAKYKEASKWYEKLYKLKLGNLELKLLLRYSQSLKTTGNKSKSEEIYNLFLKASKILNEDYSSAEDYLELIEKNSNRYQFNELDINSKHIDFGGFTYKDTLYFSSTRAYRKPFQRIDTWTNQPFLDIFTTTITKEGYSKPKLLKGSVNGKHHESSLVITKDGKTMYFTRSNNTMNRKKRKEEATRLKIYRATKVNNRWTNIVDLTINEDSFSNAHPVLSPDEKRLYYVSNMPYSIGQTDIYYVDIFDGNKLGKPTNLGVKINTKGRESFPFITKDYELYFSSDGHYGLGGYDVFYVDLKSKEKELINVGKPINSTNDDFAFTINSTSKKGYFSSNRSLVDNIYEFTETKPITNFLKQELKGIVTDKHTDLPIYNSVVSILNNENEVLNTIYTNKLGEFTAIINPYRTHIVKAEKETYTPEDVFIKKKSKGLVNLRLTKNLEQIDKGVDLAKILNIVIYFDFDKASIRESSKVELEKIVVVLKKHPAIKLMLKGHTDSKGLEEYNMKLSQSRAIASMNYLLEKGISKERLFTKGYGESQLINNCINFKDCSDQQNQQNRRTEFVIIKTK
jgi:outer membrane protein OmpA-like peptidoglycan-associated protein